MLQSIKGYYDHGIIVLEEQPNLEQKVPIIVTFLDTSAELQNKTRVRKIGGLEGFINLPDDFNEPLDDLKEYMY